MHGSALTIISKPKLQVRVAYMLCFVIQQCCLQIVAGLEPELTNQFLLMLARAAAGSKPQVIDELPVYAYGTKGNNMTGSRWLAGCTKLSSISRSTSHA